MEHCVNTEIEIFKNSRSGSPSSDNAALALIMLFCIGQQRNVSGILTQRATVIVLLVNPFVWQSYRCSCLSFLKLPSNY